MYIGIDYHKRYLVATTLGSNGREIKQERVTTDRPSLDGFIKRLPAGSKIAMEATGDWYYFYELLEDKAHELYLAHPLKTRAIAEARIKTDKIDSSILAHLLRADLLPAAYVAPREIRDVREVLRYRASLVSLRTSLKNKVHAILSKNGIPMRFSNIFGKKSREYLEALPIRDCYVLELKGYLQLAGCIDELLSEVTEQIRGLVAHNPQAELLISIPGIGYYSALLIVSEIGDFRRFPNPKKLCCYAGLVPSVFSSGGKTYHGAITRQGSKWLRWILIELSLHFIRHDKRLKSLYDRVSHKHGHNSAKVAVAREMLKIIYAMLRDNRPYIPGLPGRLRGVMAS
jgi:transposase